MVQVCCPTILFTHWGGKATKRVTIQHNKKMVIAKASHCASYKMRLRTQTAFYPDATNTAYVYPLINEIILLRYFYYCVYVLLFTLTSLAQVLSLSLSLSSSGILGISKLVSYLWSSFSVEGLDLGKLISGSVESCEKTFSTSSCDELDCPLINIGWHYWWLKLWQGMCLKAVWGGALLL